MAQLRAAAEEATRESNQTISELQEALNEQSAVVLLFSSPYLVIFPDVLQF